MKTIIRFKKAEGWTDEIERLETIHYLRETISEICDRVRNKMVAPYAALQIARPEGASKELIDISLKSIDWLCHAYLPEINNMVETRMRKLTDK